MTSGWFSSSHIRLYLDVNVGAVRHDVEQDRAHANKLSDKLRDLNERLEGIRREQQVLLFLSFLRDVVSHKTTVSTGTGSRIQESIGEGQFESNVVHAHPSHLPHCHSESRRLRNTSF